MVVFAAILTAEAIPGLSDLPEKVLTQCGLVTAISWLVIIWLASQLAKSRSDRESDRAGMLKLFNEQSSAYEKVATAHAELKGMIFAIQANRNANDDDD